ncbi:putative response regulator receiver protein [Phycisphaera mikurensis NBRC 102666]|uniref:Putative response regulator receiver protein n=2 Tax=Phycisphaera TaxID=666508 RepID=I0IEX9_PHYMF|nr:putative response regulator receiver protein [Phycisphaera mikurensis NBRC 102666]
MGAGKTLLLVDDNEDDRFLARLALGRVASGLEIAEVADGRAALDWLRAAEDPPALVLLDLKMPRLDGAGVLGERRADARLRPIPVAVFTTSVSEEDVKRSYDLGASVYLPKPDSVDRLEEMLGDLMRVYLKHARPATP